MNLVFITFFVLLLKLKHNRIVFLKINLSGPLAVKNGKAYREKEKGKREFNLGILINSALYTVSVLYLLPHCFASSLFVVSELCWFGRCISE